MIQRKTEKWSELFILDIYIHQYLDVEFIMASYTGFIVIFYFQNKAS